MPIPLRLSGTAANIPANGAAIGSDYFATDTGIVYRGTTGAWVPRPSFSEVNGVISDTFANRPTAATCVGYLFYATDTQAWYEAFPTAWFTRAIADSAEAKRASGQMTEE